MLGDIFHFRGKLLRSGMVGVFTQEITVFLECRAASCGICDNGLEAIVEHGGDILAGKLSRFVSISSMSLKRPATVLPMWHPHLNAVPVQNADCRMIQFREGNIRNAAGMQGDSGPPLSFSRKHSPNLVEEEMVIDPRLKL